MANLHPAAEGLHVALFLLGVFSLLLRFYSRAFVLKRWGLDDSIAVGILILYAALQAMHQLMLNAGCGTAEPNHCNPKTNPNLPKILLATQMLYALTHFTIKSGFLAFYVHLSPIGTFRIMVYLGWALNGAIFIANELLIILRCRPISEVFSPGSAPHATCMSPAVTFWSPVVLNLVVDIYILILPMPVIWTLRMPAKRRLAVLAIFSSGFTAILTSAFWVFAWGKMRDRKTSPALAINTIISSVELFFAVMAVNMPAFKPLWTRMVGDVTTRQGDSYQMGGMSREKAMPRSEVTPLSTGSAQSEKRHSHFGSALTPQMGRPTKKSMRGAASESEEDLVDARTLSGSNDARAAEQGQIWRDRDGVEFVMHPGPGSSSDAKSGVARTT